MATLPYKGLACGTHLFWADILASHVQTTQQRLGPVPLERLAQAAWARDAATFGSLPDQHQRPLMEKESHQWLTSLAASRAMRPPCPPTHFVSVGDREADVYDLFVAPRPAGVDLLVRATQDRVTATPGGRLHAVVAAAPVTASATITVPARGDQPARTVTLRPPPHRARKALRPVTVWAVLAREEGPPLGWLPWPGCC